MNVAVQWIIDRFTSTADRIASRKRVVTGKMPEDAQAKEVRDRFFSQRESIPETKSNLYDRMQSGGA
jgi:hypothetical protein